MTEAKRLNKASQLERLQWLTVEQCKALLGCEQRHFLQYWRQKLPEDALRRDGRRVYYHGATLLKIYAIDYHEKQRSRMPVNAEEAALQGDDTPALERLRAAMADIKELDLARMRGEMLDRDEIRAAWAPVAEVMRRAILELGKQYGPAAAELINDALEEAIGVVEKTTDSSQV